MGRDRQDASNPSRPPQPPPRYIRGMDSAARRLDFNDHRRALGDNRYVYPVVSRRSKGLSIGVNLNPDKVCNFDCPYCQVDRSVPPAVTEVDLLRLGEELDALLGLVTSGSLWDVPPFDTVAPALRRVNDVAFAGDGEPTAYAGFGQAVALVGERLAAFGLAGVKPIVLTNATLLHRPSGRRGHRRALRLGRRGLGEARRGHRGAVSGHRRHHLPLRAGAEELG
ncbi:MAG: hypothetical protein IPO67_29645 [Deltaproteobacteria bacterium]|nr:hypothetical protein [Deltaproteobacteria bacterium]